MSIKGVRLHKASNKWTATVWYNGKAEHIGLYKTEAEAIFNLNKRKSQLEEQGIKLGQRLENKYVDNREMMYEMIVSKAQGKMTNKLLLMSMKIVKGVNRKFRYTNEDDRDDVISYSYEIIIKNWYHFDEDKFENPFSYISEIVKRAHALQFKQLQKTRLNTVSLDYINDEGKRMINI